MYEGSRWFLDEDNVKRQVRFKNGVNDKVILANILRIDFDIF